MKEYVLQAWKLIQVSFVQEPGQKEQRLCMSGKVPKRSQNADGAQATTEELGSISRSHSSAPAFGCRCRKHVLLRMLALGLF